MARWLVLLILVPLLVPSHTLVGDTAPVEGLREFTPTDYALENAKIVVAPGRTIDKGTILVRQGRIVAVGADVEVPAGIARQDLAGKTIYPGLIDAYTKSSAEGTVAGPGYWNDNIAPQRNLTASLPRDEALHKSLRSQGITTRLVAPTQGILQGEAAVVLTGDDPAELSILRDHVALTARLTVPFGGSRGYPRSPMGAIALARQAMFDARWYADALRAAAADGKVRRPELNVALETLGRYVDGGGLVLAETTSEISAIRADEYGREFGLKLALVGSGREYLRLGPIKATGRTVIVPLDFPKPPDVATEQQAMNTTLNELMHWKLAPENPGRLAKAGVPILLTSEGLSDRGQFLAQLRKAIERGLPADTALESLTTAPAKLYDIDDQVGTIEVGKLANFVVTTGDLFAKETKIVATWVRGREYKLESEPIASFAGTWQLKTGRRQLAETNQWKLVVKGSPQKPSATIVPVPKPEKPKPEEKKTEGESQEQPPSDTQATPPTNSEEKPEEQPQTEDTKPEGIKPEQAAPEATRPTAPNGPTTEENPASGESNKTEAPPKDEAKQDAKPKAPGAVELKPIAANGYQLTGTFKGDTFGIEGRVSLTLTLVSDNGVSSLIGHFVLPNGDRVAITGVAWPEEKEEKEKQEENSAEKDATPKKEDEQKPNDEKPDEDAKQETKEESDKLPVNVTYPLGTYGVTEAPKSQSVAFTGATIWTSGPRGTIENATILIEGGKIVAVGTDIEIPAGTKTIDCQGKHITPGLIDCHSHIATDGGINETGQAITAEVRIGDTIDSNDINIYYQLAGGVTTSNILHGSANPIGGQNQVIKLRWGATPAEMKFEDAPYGIKFALGENVKQSNWSERGTGRYPQTRMGVDELMIDEFNAALHYRDEWQRWERDRRGLPPRRDLELDTIVEILEGKRWIHCHSYRQSEILALLRTLEQYDITIGTLQHILEGYKLAPELAAHGAMASSFSDWWAYKFEVYDAIPFNGAVMYRAGIVVSFNSDDAEMARRLNQEAAKAVKYGGVPPEEALKFVTLNPARQLRIDDKVGSLEPGKQADLVVWSGAPLSTMSRCEQTWIDGREYFSLARDKEFRERDAKLHRQLVQEVLASGDPPAKPGENRTDPATLWPRVDEYCTSKDCNIDHLYQQQ